MDAVEKRALAQFAELLMVGGCEGELRIGRAFGEALVAEIAALTPPEGYVLVPAEVQKDADRFRFLASWAGAEFNSERGYLRWYLSRKGRGFASLAETVDQCLSSARREVP